MVAVQSITSSFAGRYATALFDLAKETGAVDAVVADLAAFDALIDAHEDMQRFVRSPVFSRGFPVDSRLASRGSLWSLGLGIAAACGLGAATFLTLSSNRKAPPPVVPAPVVARAISAPPPPRPLPASVPPAPAPLPATPAPQPVAAPDLHSPAMVVDLSQPPAAAPVPMVSLPGTLPVTDKDPKLSADEDFSARISGSKVEVARSTRLRDLTHTAPQGTVIPGVLETAIDSDLPGFVRAVVSRDVHGFDGKAVLIPRGSKLVGQYRSAVALSQTRAFVVWSRILTPDGVSIDIGSPSTDTLGRGGLEGETDTHFFARFGSAILLSVLGAGLNALSEPSNNNTSIVIGSTQQANQVASIALQKQIDIPTTIKVPQGTPLQVFVTRDLDFAGTQ